MQVQEQSGAGQASPACHRSGHLDPWPMSREPKEVSTSRAVTTRKLTVINISGGIFRTSSLGDSISSSPERTAPRRWGEVV